MHGNKQNEMHARKHHRIWMRPRHKRTDTRQKSVNRYSIIIVTYKYYATWIIYILKANNSTFLLYLLLLLLLLLLSPYILYQHSGLPTWCPLCVRERVMHRYFWIESSLVSRFTVCLIFLLLIQWIIISSESFTGDCHNSALRPIWGAIDTTPFYKRPWVREVIFLLFGSCVASLLQYTNQWRHSIAVCDWDISRDFVFIPLSMTNWLFLLFYGWHQPSSVACVSGSRSVCGWGTRKRVFVRELHAMRGFFFSIVEIDVSPLTFGWSQNKWTHSADAEHFVANLWLGHTVWLRKYNLPKDQSDNKTFSICTSMERWHDPSKWRI